MSSMQGGWRSCSKCQGMHFSEMPNFEGVCPAGGQHDHVNSWLYSVEYNVGNGPNVQGGWASCPRCQGLHFAGFVTKGVCPAGGQHTETNSFAYALTHDVAAAPNMQDQWKSCEKCQGLFYGPFNGRCPAGGAHNAGGSFNYTLPFITQPAPSPPVAPQTHSWGLPPGQTITAGNVTLETTKITISSDGNWSWEGGVHDNSTFYGDNWACGFAFAQLGHGAGTSGSLGATLSGPAADGGIHLSGQDPWLVANFAAAASSSVHISLVATGDIGPLISSLIQDLGQLGNDVVEFIELVGSHLSSADPDPVPDPDPGSGGEGDELRRPGNRFMPPVNHMVPHPAGVPVVANAVLTRET